jgi:hypothetical protein
MKTQTIATLALLALSAGTILAEDKRPIVTIGYGASPLLQALRSQHPNADAREMMRGLKTAKGRNAAMDMRAALQAELGRMDALVADLAEVDMTEEDVALVDAATLSGVPVVLENVTSEKMAKLFGIGADNPLIVAEWDPKTQKGTLHFTQGQPQDDIPGADVPNIETLDNFGTRLAFVQSLISRKATKERAAAGDPLPTTGLCSTAAASFCREWRTSGLGMKRFCPNRGYGTPQYTCEFGMAYLDPELEFGLYKTGNYRYVRLRSVGSYGVANAIGRHKNSMDERFPFFSFYKVKMTPTFISRDGLPMDWNVWNMAPTNQNASTSISVTTGFNISASNAPASVDATKTTTFTGKDWSVIANPNPPEVHWAWYLSTSKGACDDKAYTQTLGGSLLNLSHWCSSRFFANAIDKLPDMSMYGYGLDANSSFGEVVYSGTKIGDIVINYSATGKVGSVWDWGRNGEINGFRTYTASDTRTSSYTIRISMGVADGAAWQQ